MTAVMCTFCSDVVLYLLHFKFGLALRVLKLTTACCHLTLYFARIPLMQADIGTDGLHGPPTEVLSLALEHLPYRGPFHFRDVAAS
ncbi:hypothetical protein PILCRDRAFT_475181 [Piloderma croceum F 1598]|uniref:Uncharacterized protein n=1 Tax=Piloderma croceum (strain F 1598) TaxID=765440 RepID=A0A0C3BY54_PILCF|nr:hypothetical protein PILCRDRAFT_475181 [Piloderma croceum F 1598]